MAKRRKNGNALTAIIIFSLIMVDVIAWNSILHDAVVKPLQTYTFALGKNSSTLMIFPHGMKVLTDAGGDDAIVDKLDAALSSSNNSYIDLAIISSPQIKNYGGYVYILDHYFVGAFIYNGRNDPDDTQSWSQLLNKIRSKNIPLITLGKGDGIHYDGTLLQILSPNNELDHSADLDDTALIEAMK